MARRKRVGISTGGGDCPGLNAVIRAVYHTARNVHDWEVFAIEDGLEGLIDLDYCSPDGNRLLDRKQIRGILGKGGTIIGTSNRSNPFKYAVRNEAGELVEADISPRMKANYDKLGLDALIMIGGDGTQAIAHQMGQCGFDIVGVPKTIDNDLACTDYTFGFDTAVNIAVEALDRVHTTAASHDRVMIVELMGRHAGFIALHAGIAGSADVILLPEIPFDIDAVVTKIEERNRAKSVFSVIVVAEGATMQGGQLSTLGEREVGAAIRLGGVGHGLAEALKPRLKQEVRVVVLGHLQRGGSPTARDRLLGTRYGVEAMNLVARGEFGRMVALRGLEIVSVTLADAVGKTKNVDPEGEMVRQARSTGVCFGDHVSLR
ncbi:MAG: 6-phosphofructokinase [Deltaproteobacteria bacterium CG2_30_63_29]|nr:MAG: 6-phosphofructokinase [Deltaproteobacteria bacterium CG2_30_63_29]PJB45301.1 MAG: 6-phosphofructokinase [Deltaproteobacteria bacterium CG_4_9_14_3_um_filter_63_12]